MQGRNQKYYNRKARPKNIKVGDKVLLLLPTDSKKLLLHWKGPFEVIELVGDVDYKIKFPTSKVMTFHANMLKKYFERQTGNEPTLHEAAAVMSMIDDTVEEEEMNFYVKIKMELYLCIICMRKRLTVMCKLTLN